MGNMIVIGTGGFAKELAGLLSSVGMELEGFIGPKPTKELPGKWIGSDRYIEKLSPSSDILIAIGDPQIRSKLAYKLKQQKLHQQTFIHPNSFIFPEIIITECFQF